MTVTHGHVGVFCLFSCPSLMCVCVCVCVCACAHTCASTMWMKPEALPPTLSSLAVCDDPGAIPGFFLNSLALMHGPVIWIKIQEEFLTKWLGGEVRPQWRLLDSFWQGTLQQMCLIFFFLQGVRFWGTTSDVTLGNKGWLSCLSKPAAFKVHILKEKKSGSDICHREYRDAFKLRLILKSISTKSSWKKDECVYLQERVWKEC